MLFNCPQCGQTLKAADSAAGKKCRCTSCKQLVLIPGGRQTEIAPDTSNNRKSTAKPATVASELNDMIVRQHEQILQEAAEIFQQRERERRRAEEQGRVQKYYSNDGSPPASPWRTILSVLMVILLSLGVICCGVLGYFGFGGTAELKVGTYAASAKGHGEKKTSNAGAARGEGILNRMTGSEFWLYVTSLPNNDPAITSSVMDRFGTQSTSQHSVNRGNLSGNRFNRVAAESLNMPSGVRCEMEVFVIRNELVVACYIPGSAKHKAGIQSKSAFEGSEEFWDKPESFFESITTTPP